jgi:hypothetical protein
VERAQHTQRDPCKAVWVALTVLRSFNDLLCKEFLYYGRLTFAMEGPAGNVIGLAQNLSCLIIKSSAFEQRYDRGHYAYLLQSSLPRHPASRGEDDLNIPPSARGFH